MEVGGMVVRSGTVVKHHLGFKSEVLVWVSAQSANLQALAPLQSEATSSPHFAFEAQRHKVACSQTLFMYRGCGTVSVQVIAQ